MPKADAGKVARAINDLRAALTEVVDQVQALQRRMDVLEGESR
jgi:hypothetical protein